MAANRKTMTNDQPSNDPTPPERRLQPDSSISFAISRSKSDQIEVNLSNWRVKNIFYHVCWPQPNAANEKKFKKSARQTSQIDFSPPIYSRGTLISPARRLIGARANN